MIHRSRFSVFFCIWHGALLWKPWKQGLFLFTSTRCSSLCPFVFAGLVWVWALTSVEWHGGPGFWGRCEQRFFLLKPQATQTGPSGCGGFLRCTWTTLQKWNVWERGENKQISSFVFFSKLTYAAYLYVLFHYMDVDGPAVIRSQQQVSYALFHVLYVWLHLDLDLENTALLPGSNTVRWRWTWIAKITCWYVFNISWETHEPLLTCTQIPGKEWKGDK